MPNLSQEYPFQEIPNPGLEEVFSHPEPQPPSTSNYTIGCLLMLCIARLLYVRIVVYLLSTINSPLLHLASFVVDVIMVYYVLCFISPYLRYYCGLDLETLPDIRLVILRN